MRKCGLPVTHAGAAYPFAYDDKNCRTRNCFLSAAVLFQSVFSKCDETVQQFHGNAFLAHDLQLLCVIRSNKCHYISVCAEACSGDLDIVGHRVSSVRSRFRLRSLSAFLIFSSLTAAGR